MAEASLRKGLLVPLLAPWQLPQQEIHAVYPSPRMVPAKVNLFIDWLQGKLGQDWWALPKI